MKMRMKNIKNDDEDKNEEEEKKYVDLINLRKK